MNVELLQYPKDDDWLLCKQVTLVTVGRKSSMTPSMQWRKKILAARHSPIRTLNFCFLLTDIPYYVSTHLVRHVHATPFVKSQRNDRQSDYDRTKAPQDAPVNMAFYVNAEELMVIANKRLCNKADPMTRELVSMMCKKVELYCPEFEGLLVPMCEYRGGLCNEFESCGRADTKRATVTLISHDGTVEISVSEGNYRKAKRILLRQEDSNYATLFYPDEGDDV